MLNVESRKGAGPGPTGSRWFPFPAHQTGRAHFEHPAFRQTSPTSSRKPPHRHIAEPQNTPYPEHNRVRERGTAQRMHFVAVTQEVPYAVVNVMIDRSISHQPRSITEVVGPAPQNPVELISHLRPRCHVLAHQQVSHFLPQLDNALLRRTRPEIPLTSLSKTVRPEAVSQKIKPLCPCLLDAGLRLVQRESDPGHHTPRPIQCLRRAAATENHEVSSSGESHPEALSEPYVNVSAHTAPAMEPRCTPICQCAHNFGSRLEIRATQ